MAKAAQKINHATEKRFTRNHRHAWWRKPIKDSSWRRLHVLLDAQECNSDSVRPTFSGGSRDIWRTESSSMAKKTNVDAGIASLTLWPAGDDRSRIRRHLPGWCCLGITPKGLMWRPKHGGSAKGPATREAASSVVRYWSIIVACWSAERRFDVDDRNERVQEGNRDENHVEYL